MSAQLIWTLLLIGCVVGLVPGKLHKPLNLKLESRNFSLFLTWLPNPENRPTVTYKVGYIVGYKADGENRWKSVPTCKNVTVPECDLTCVLMTERYLQHTVRVKAVYLRPSSPWVELGNISYMFSVEPDPPILHLIQGENNVFINASMPSPSCMPRILSLSLKFLVDVTRDKTLQQIIQEQAMDGSSITIKTHGYKGEYCFAAKTKYVIDKIKVSPLSNPVCKFFVPKEDSHKGPLLIGFAVPVATILFFIICLAFWYNATKKVKTPNVLDFPVKESNYSIMLWFTESEHGPREYNEMDQVSSVLLVQYSETGVIEKDYPISSYMQRRTMQDNINKTGNSAHRDYTSSNSDKSSSDCNGENTSGSNTGISVTLDKMQINDIQQDVTVSEGIQTLSPTNSRKHHLFNSPCLLDSNDLSNVNFNTLCIADSDQQETSDDESSNQLLTDSEDPIEKLSSDVTDCDIPHSNRTVKYGKPQKNCNSGYEQRSNMTRRC
ncbi:interferon lambda receptor 1 [Pseudophryne corroboree]|uniref:interferon lambda receptor 1 n=1 Tax=Pseudophryne corroboree TaxID=495146 RepID=UPI003081DC4E